MDVVSAPKPVQCQITVSALMAHPASVRVIGKKVWSKPMRDGIAALFKNRRFIDQNGANATESKDFRVITEKIAKLLRTNKEVSCLLLFFTSSTATDLHISHFLAVLSLFPVQRSNGSQLCHGADCSGWSSCKLQRCT